MTSDSRVDLSSLLRAIAAQFTAISNQTGVRLALTVEDGIEVAADDELLQRSLFSLLTNVFRYAAEEATIAMSLSSEEAAAVICLGTSLSTPDGLVPVVPERPLDHFESILEGDPTRIHASLSNVYGLITGYGGSFEVSQDATHHWLFVVRLPRQDTEVDGDCENPPGADRPAHIGETAPGSAAQVPRKGGARPSNVLLLIADPDLSAFAARGLAPEYRVLTAHDIPSAMTQLNMQGAELVVVDRSFRSIGAALRGSPQLASIPVMTLINNAEDALEPDPQRPFIESFLRMPFTEHILRVRVEGMIDQHRQTTRRLRESEDRYRALFQYSPDAIIVSRNECVVLVNEAALRLFNARHAEQMLGHSVFDLIDPQYHKTLRRRLDHALRSRKPLPLFEPRIVRLDGLRVDVEALSVQIPLGGEPSVHSLLRDISDRKQLERQVINAATAEQIRIGGEIHDGIGQELTALDFMTQSLARQLEAAAVPESLRTRLTEVHQYVERALRTARLLAKGLSPAQIGPEGLPGELSRMTADVQTASGIECRFSRLGNAPELDETTAVHLYRIAQEAVTNAIRHARPKHVRITLESGRRALRLEVKDDGVGLDAPGVGQPGVGLRIMRYRANLIGARLSVTGDAEGTRVACELPR